MGAVGGCGDIWRPKNREEEAMSNKYFVILHQSEGVDDKPTPLIDEHGDMKLFDTRENAETAGSNHLVGSSFGYEVYEWPAEWAPGFRTGERP